MFFLTHSPIFTPQFCISVTYCPLVHRAPHRKLMGVKNWNYTIHLEINKPNAALRHCLAYPRYPAGPEVREQSSILGTGDCSPRNEATDRGWPQNNRPTFACLHGILTISGSTSKSASRVHNNATARHLHNRTDSWSHRPSRYPLWTSTLPRQDRRTAEKPAYPDGRTAYSTGSI